MNSSQPVPFQNTFSKLPDRFYSREEPTPVSKPQLIRTNQPLALQLGIDPKWLESADGISMMAGNLLPAGADPIATAYAGHQFGGWNPQLGDGRAILLGEIIDTHNRRQDIQLKGAGDTLYSRMGDGRSPLGPVLREYLVSEAMAARGIPTTRSLGAVATGDTVYRDRALPGAILTRVASSHIRVGTFQYFSARKDIEGIRLLADHVLDRDFPDAKHSPSPYTALLEEAILRQAKLIAQWLGAGFIHGVMNTDNMLICGETIDYGPCAFMDYFDPIACYSSIDHGKRYAYKNQPVIAHWNLSWFAQSLIPILDEDENEATAIAQNALNQFPEIFEDHHQQVMHAKCGFGQITTETTQFIDAFMGHLAAEHQDFTQAFRHLADLSVGASSHVQKIPYQLPESFNTLLENWYALREKTPSPSDLHQINPVFIPRNHLIQEAIETAEYQGDLTLFHTLADILAAPFEYDQSQARYSLPPEPSQVVEKTFCGT